MRRRWRERGEEREKQMETDREVLAIGSTSGIIVVNITSYWQDDTISLLG